MSEGGKPPGLMATPLTAQGNIQLEQRVRERIAGGIYPTNPKFVNTNRKAATRRLNVLQAGYSQSKYKKPSELAKIERLTTLIGEIDAAAGTGAASSLVASPAPAPAPSVKQQKAPYVPYVEEDAVAAPVIKKTAKERLEEVRSKKMESQSAVSGMKEGVAPAAPAPSSPVASAPPPNVAAVPVPAASTEWRKFVTDNIQEIKRDIDKQIAEGKQVGEFDYDID